MKKNLLFWVIGILGLLFDQVTKFWITQNLHEVGDTIPLITDVFHLTYVENKGAAWGIFSEDGFWLRWLSLAVSLGLIAYGILVSKIEKTEQLTYGFILAGALGNGWDRFRLGYVVDFLNFPFIHIPVFNIKLLEFTWIQFPVFNFADVFINLGFFCFIIAIFPTSSRSKRR